MFTSKEILEDFVESSHVHRERMTSQYEDSRDRSAGLSYGFGGPLKDPHPEADRFLAASEAEREAMRQTVRVPPKDPFLGGDGLTAQIRNLAGSFSQQEIAKRLHVHRHTVARLLSGKTKRCRNIKATPSVREAMLADHDSGMRGPQLSVKYGLSVSYVYHLLKESHAKR